MYWNDYFQDNSQSNSWNWNATWQYVKSISHNSCRSFDTNDKLIHFIKCSNNLLPTIDNLRKCTYIYDQALCPSCQQSEENLLHLMTCPGTEEGFRQVEEQVTKKIYNYISKTKTKASTCSKLMEITKICFKKSHE
jgi:hypothetical protein